MSSAADSSLPADHVVGTFRREELSAALAATHRAGFGPQTRVFDAARGSVARQLERAGLEIREGVVPAADAVLIIVTAPGRAMIVAELFEQLGAVSVLFAVGRGGARSALPAPSFQQPDIRIGDDAGMTSEA